MRFGVGILADVMVEVRNFVAWLDLGGEEVVRDIC